MLNIYCNITVELYLLLNDVVGYGAAAVVLGAGPAQRHRLLVEVGDAKVCGLPGGGVWVLRRHGVARLGGRRLALLVEGDHLESAQGKENL